jgi:hypothetical protein
VTTSTWTQSFDPAGLADKALSMTARVWFTVAVIGQWIFMAYVIAFYGGAVAQGSREAWNEILPSGYSPGDVASNIAVATHLLLAVIVTLGGGLQLVPALRRIAPRFHRINGRLFVLSAIVTSIAGLYMVWTHTSVEKLVPHIGVSVDAILIITFAWLALQTAIRRDMRAHRRWALRLFLVCNAGWFFRIGLMFWVMVNRGAVGFDPETFRGPFINFLSFADYLLPLVMLELYLRAQVSSNTVKRIAIAGALAVATLVTAIGIFAASMVLWLPRM